MEYHLRVDITLKSALEFSKKFISKFKPDIYCVSFEIAKLTKKEHIHMYLKFDLNSVPAKSSLSDYMKKNDYFRKYSFAKQKKSTMKHLLYILKDEKPILSNLNAELMDELMEKCMEIKMDKKLTIKEKYYNYWLDKITLTIDIVEEDHNITILSHRTDQHIITSDFFIFNSIMEYVYLNDLLPPNKSQMHQYIQFIKLKIIHKHTESIHNTDIDKKHYMFTSASSYGIFIPDDVRKNNGKKGVIFDDSKYYLI